MALRNHKIALLTALGSTEMRRISTLLITPRYKFHLHLLRKSLHLFKNIKRNVIEAFDIQQEKLLYGVLTLVFKGKTSFAL